VSATRDKAAAPRTGESVVVRRATGRDLDTVVALRLALLREHASNPIYRRLAKDVTTRARKLFARQLESPGEITLLAERDGRIVGILRCVESSGSPLLSPEQYAYISSVYVDPAVRRTGVLRALLARAEVWARSLELEEFRLHSVADGDAANRAWDALGFEIVEHLRVRAVNRPE
jgi:ribosomal protein S18 acetylase RimI-like enzyme